MVAKIWLLQPNELLRDVNATDANHYLWHLSCGHLARGRYNQKPFKGDEPTQCPPLYLGTTTYQHICQSYTGHCLGLQPLSP